MPSRVAGKTYGTVSAERQKELSGLEFVQGLIDGTLPVNTIAETLGYDVTEAVSGRVVVTVKPNGTHLNPAGTVHGGLAATLLDSCMGLAIQSTLEKGVGQTTPRVQDFTHAADHAGNRSDQGRGRRLEPRPPCRDCRRTDHRSPGAVARPRHDDVPDLSELNCLSIID
jgi:Domain of unknown function (DUF4442)